MKWVYNTKIIKADNQWCEKHGYYWTGGIVECRNISSDDVNSKELSVPLMVDEDYYTLSEWLEMVVTDDLMTEKDLYEKFNRYLGRDIKWFSKPEFL